MKKIHVGDLIKNILSEVKKRAKERKINIQYENINFEVTAGLLLEELFLNLIENSIIHSGCKKIRITGRSTNKKYIITIGNDSCGILEGERNKTFERGYKKVETDGSGLGMYLVKEIAENYSGAVEVKDSELCGARFDVKLKKAMS